jgi:type IV secretory pathway VirJ component
MKKLIWCCCFLLIFTNQIDAFSTDTLIFGMFGKVTIYKPSNNPEAFVIFISGDGGWNSGVINMAKNIVDQGAMVIGIDIQHYFKRIKKENVKCYYLAGDFEELSLTVQKKYKFTQYMKPILVGYSSGATLAYGLLAQAPSNTFKGVISLGFCPDIETSKTLCNGTGLTTHTIKEGKAYYLEATNKLTAPFIVLQGTTDQVCSYSETAKFMQGMHLGELVSLPKVGHGFSVTRNWLPQFISAYNKVVNSPSFIEKKTSDNTLLQAQHITPFKSDLPLILIPPLSKDTLPLAFVISGDGGWTSFDQTLSEQLAEKGMPVVGLDAQKYFWNAKTPEESSAAIAQVVLHYMQQWNKKSFILVGYSFGACVAPFIANRFSLTLKHELKAVYCLSPDETADFEIHLTDMLQLGTNEKFNVIEEIIKIKAMNPVCIFGVEEEGSLRNHFSNAGAKVVTLPGNHHYNNDYAAVVESILKGFIIKH